MNLPYWIQDLLVALALGVAFLLLWLAGKSDRYERQRRRFLRDKVGLVSLFVVTLFLAICAADLLLLPQYNNDGFHLSLLDWCFQKVPQETSYSAPLAWVDAKGAPLNGRHLLGTDALGSDVLLETLKACRTALLIGSLTSLIYIPIGVLLGIIAGYFRGWVDDLIQFVYSTVASIPVILLLVSILVVIGKGIPQITLALGLTSWIGLCRLLRGESMRQAGRQYCEAARALGQGSWKIITRHLLPNMMHLVVINFVLGFSGIVLTESILSYIGVGVPIGTASWGIMIDSARTELNREPSVWWNLAAASSALFLLVLALNLLGDALRKAFDPKAA